MRRLRNRLMACGEGTSTLENRVLLAALDQVSGEKAPMTAADSPATLELTAGDNTLLQELHDVSEQTGNEQPQAFYATSTGLSKALTTVTAATVSNFNATIAVDTDVLAHTHPTRNITLNDRGTQLFDGRFAGNLNPSEPVALSKDISPPSHSDIAAASVFNAGKYNGYVSLVQQTEHYTHAFVPSQMSILLGKELGFEELARQLLGRIQQSHRGKISDIRNRDGGKLPSEFTQAEENEVLLAGVLGMAELAQGSYYVGISGAAEGGGTTLVKLTEQNIREIAEFLAESEPVMAGAVVEETSTTDGAVTDQSLAEETAADEPVVG